MLRAFLPALLLLAVPPAMSQADRDLILAVEEGGVSITLIDGERLEPVQRLATHRPVSGPPQFTADARFGFFASSDGWVVKYDLRTLAVVAQAQVGQGGQPFAVSADGNFVAVAYENPRGLAILDADLRPRRLLPSSSRVSSIHDTGRRRSFVIALEDLPELWEVSYDPKAEPIAEGVVHDFRLKEGTFVEGFLNPRRTKLDQPLDELLFLPEGSLAVGVQRDGTKALVVQLDVRRTVASFEQSGSLRPAGGVAWSGGGKRLLAIPNPRQSLVTIVDLADWKVARQIPVRGPGAYVRSHGGARHAIVGHEAGDTLHAIDKETLEVTATLTPQPGKRLAPAQLDRSGRYVLAVLAEPQGALLVLDAGTLQEVKRIALKEPVAVYNLSHRSHELREGR